MNRKIIVLLLVLLCSIIVSGCIHFGIGISVNPLYLEKDLVLEPAFEGDWIHVDEEGIFTFKASKDSSYYMSLTEIKTDKTDSTKVEHIKWPGELESHLFRLNKYLFLDMYPREPETENFMYTGHLIPLHSFWRVYLENDTLILAGFNHDLVKKMVEQKRLNIGHEILDDRIILTAPTDTLQSFVDANIDSIFISKEGLFNFKCYRQK